MIADAFPPLGGAWLEDGTIVYPNEGQASLTGDGAPGLFRVQNSGGVPERLTTVDSATERYHSFPAALPGSKAVLFTSTPEGADEARIMAVSLETGEQRTLVDVGYDAGYVPSGHLVFGRQGALWAVPFDPDRLETEGDEVVALQGLEMTDASVSFSYSADGLLAYMPGGEPGGGPARPRTLIWVDRDGREETLPTPARQYDTPRLSPDGGRVAVVVYDGAGYDLWVYNVATGAGLRLTHGEFTDQAMVPVWTPDGERVVYRAPDSGDLYWTAADGSGDPEQLLELPTSQDYSTSVSPDGATLVFSRIYDAGGLHREVWQVRLQGERNPTALLEGFFARANAEISPDGRWLAFNSSESGQWEIYIQPYPGPGAKTPVSIGGGQALVWSADGRELYFRSGRRVMVASVRTEPTLSVGEPRVLFEGSQYDTGAGGSRQYHVAPDGRFLMIWEGEAVSDVAPPQFDHLVVVENWFDELRRLAPVD